MLLIMGKSGKDLFFQASQLARRHSSVVHEVAGKGDTTATNKQVAVPGSSVQDSVDSSRLTLIIQAMVASQVFIVGLTFTSYHVQIITRLSSGYPAWYWWVAACLRSPKTRTLGGGIVVFMVMYASIQAVLFASFLPPA